MNFDQAFDRLISNEDGYANDPADPGGETNWGISKRSYPEIDIKNLTREGAKAIYKRDFWQSVKMDQVDAAIAFQVFDAAVNSGINNAVKMLQRAVNVVGDGKVGPVTIGAVNAMPLAKVLMRFAAERIDFWRGLPTWPSFGNGWAGRAANNLRYAAEDI
jgi:lysozyme family protein